MGIVASITHESVSGSEWVTLGHGTDLGSANWIAKYGLSHQRLLAACQGAWCFWTTMNFRIASDYAQLNPIVYGGGIPAIIRFDVPKPTLREFFTNVPQLAFEAVEDEGIQFLPETFAVLNNVMTNVSVINMTESNWTQE